MDGKTGWLRDVKDFNAWAEVMKSVVDDEKKEEIATMGKNGRSRVESEFSRTKMSQRFETEIEEMINGRRNGFLEWNDILLGLGVVGVFLTALVLTVVQGSPQSRVPGKYRKVNM